MIILERAKALFFVVVFAAVAACRACPTTQGFDKTPSVMYLGVCQPEPCEGP